MATAGVLGRVDVVPVPISTARFENGFFFPDPDQELGPLEPSDVAPEVGGNLEEVTAALAGRPEQLTRFRLRRRGWLTNVLASLSVGDQEMLVPGGGKTSSGSARSWLTMINGAGVKVLGEDRVHFDGRGHQLQSSDVLVRVQVGETILAVSVGLYAALYKYCCYRPRTADLLASLRARAVQVSKELDMPDTYLAVVLPGTVALAHLVPELEKVSLSALGGEMGMAAGEYSEDLSKGEVSSFDEETGQLVSEYGWADILSLGSANISWGRKLPRAKA